MDLRSYQRQMCLTMKKYLNLISSKRDNFHEKSVEREYLELLREIISIHESQKSVITALRGIKNSPGDSSSSSNRSLSPPSSGANFSSQSYLISSHLGGPPTPTDEESSFGKTKTEGGVEEELGKKADFNFISEDHSFDVISLENDSQPGFMKCAETTGLVKGDFVSTDGPDEENKENPPLSPWQEKENLDDDDIHDLVTAYEFMQSLGLLTIKECEDVLKKRRERHKKNALSHVFCQTIWEKQETKRKKRDWLLSSSPPQLRRKIRPGSHPPSRQASRPTSPAEGGSSSPTSSLSPPSPSSPGVYNQNSQSSEEICPLCKEKGASFQCDGCGVLYHSSCVNCPDEESDYFSEWLCPKCEKLGLRASTYTDPLHPKFSKEDFAKKNHPLPIKADQTLTKAGINKSNKRLKNSTERNAFQIRKYVSFTESQKNLINCSTTALSLAPSFHSPTDSTSSNTPTSHPFRIGTLNSRSVQMSLSPPFEALPVECSTAAVTLSLVKGTTNELTFPPSVRERIEPHKAQRFSSGGDFFLKGIPPLTEGPPGEGLDKNASNGVQTDFSSKGLVCPPSEWNQLKKDLLCSVIHQQDPGGCFSSNNLQKRGTSPIITTVKFGSSSCFDKGLSSSVSLSKTSTTSAREPRRPIEHLPDLIGSCQTVA